MPGVSLSVRAVATILGVMGLSVVLAVWLNLLRFEETYTALVERRLAVVLEDAHNDILVGLDLGLRPDTMESLPSILERALSDMPEAHAARVLDCTGEPVAAATKGESVVLAALDPRAIPATTHWNQRIPEGLRSGLWLTDSFGDCAGILVLEMTTEAQDTALAAVRERLLLGGALALLLVLPAVIAVSRILRRRKRLMDQLCADLETLGEGAGPGDPATLEIHHALTDSEARMIRAYQQARASLAEDASRSGRPAT